MRFDDANSILKDAASNFGIVYCSTCHHLCYGCRHYAECGMADFTEYSSAFVDSCRFYEDADYCGYGEEEDDDEKEDEDGVEAVWKKFLIRYLSQ